MATNNEPGSRPAAHDEAKRSRLLLSALHIGLVLLFSVMAVFVPAERRWILVVGVVATLINLLYYWAGASQRVMGWTGVLVALGLSAIAEFAPQQFLATLFGPVPHLNLGREDIALASGETLSIFADFVLAGSVPLLLTAKHDSGLAPGAKAILGLLGLCLVCSYGIFVFAVPGFASFGFATFVIVALAAAAAEHTSGRWQIAISGAALVVGAEILANHFEPAWRAPVAQELQRLWRWAADNSRWDMLWPMVIAGFAVFVQNLRGRKSPLQALGAGAFVALGIGIVLVVVASRSG
jgi:hypothetical protein